jgi:hypothetical protein
MFVRGIGVTLGGPDAAAALPGVCCPFEPIMASLRGLGPQQMFSVLDQSIRVLKSMFRP